MMTFQELHRQAQPLLICNVWDVASAKVAEDLGFQALGTSSAAIAATMGYQDGEAMSFDELCFILKRIAKNTSLPLSVDLEAGYARDTPTIVSHIRQLTGLGVAGINLEDSRVVAERTLLEAEPFAYLIEQIKNQCQDRFLNIRTDTYLLGHPQALEETKRRIRLYENAGADAIFVPGLVKEDEISEIVSATPLPLNLMCLPGLPGFRVLGHLGVRRISMGDFAFKNMYAQLRSSLLAMQQQQSPQPLFQL
ncbi:isocitrate lyase/phosphoenolpyruvate mutase family protein [Catalinimonas sp. 4WD22]|uniref:isocitrate lyase/PEP mutase family protein n=1 Tax=Catalinimonas locisalis TaxID=3133978 RepID=UPI00310124D1